MSSWDEIATELGRLENKGVTLDMFDTIRVPLPVALKIKEAEVEALKADIVMLKETIAINEKRYSESGGVDYPSEGFTPPPFKLR